MAKTDDPPGHLKASALETESSPIRPGLFNGVPSDKTPSIIRVLIITYHFPPAEGIGSLRTGGLAKYLVRMGYDVTVITRDSSEVHPSCCRVFRIPFGKIRNPFRARLPARIFDRIMRLINRNLVFPDALRQWIRPASSAAMSLFKEGGFDVVISSSGPYSVHVIGKNVKKRCKVAWIADFRDLWSENHAYPYSRLRRVFDRRLEVRTLASADHITIVSAPMRETALKLHRKAVSVITNGYDPEISVSNIVLPKHDRMTFVFTGNIWPHYIYRFDYLIMSLEKLVLESSIDPRRILFRFFGNVSREWRFRAGRNSQVLEMIEFCGRVSRAEALQAQRAADVLLLLAWSDGIEKGVYTGKVFEYLAASRPILSIGGSKDDVLSELLTKTGAGRCAHTLCEIEAAILSLYRQFQSDGNIRYQGIPEEVSKFSQIEMAKKFSSVIRACVEQRKNSGDVKRSVLSAEG